VAPQRDEPSIRRTSAPKVDQEHAREVAARFLAAESRPHDPLIRAAYLALQRESDRAFMILTEGIAAPVRVGFSRCTTPYASDRELIAAVRGARAFEVTTSAIERDRPHPLLDNAQGGAYDRFRAVHDIVGHAATSFGFDRDGEFGAWLAQERLYSPMARGALATELHGEHSVRWTTGQLADHKATLLDARVVARARPGVPIFNSHRSWTGAGGSRSPGSTHGCGR
jgi:hypothetical protein